MGKLSKRIAVHALLWASTLYAVGKLVTLEDAENAMLSSVSVAIQEPSSDVSLKFISINKPTTLNLAQSPNPGNAIVLNDTLRKNGTTKSSHAKRRDGDKSQLEAPGTKEKELDDQDDQEAIWDEELKSHVRSVQCRNIHQEHIDNTSIEK
jgi:hypothetical protein